MSHVRLCGQLVSHSRYTTGRSEVARGGRRSRGGPKLRGSRGRRSQVVRIAAVMVRCAREGGGIVDPVLTGP